MKIKDKKTGKIIDEEEFALLLYKEGHHIVYCDIEGIVKDVEYDDYYILDECGNYVRIDRERFEVMKTEGE